LVSISLDFIQIWFKLLVERELQRFQNMGSPFWSQCAASEQLVSTYKAAVMP